LEAASMVMLVGTSILKTVTSTTADQDWSVPQRAKLPYAPKLSDVEEKEFRKVEKKLRDVAAIEAKIAAGVRG